MRGANHSVVLANDSRLLRDMISRVIKKRSSLIVAAQIDGNANLEQVLDETEADRVITSSYKDDGNRADLEGIIDDHQDVLFVFIGLEDPFIRTQKAGERRRYDQLDLQELIDILERDQNV
jgi:hypothetical protein